MGHRVFRLQRDHGIALELSDRGATWLSCQVPLADGSRRDVILRRAAIADASADRAFLGATVGRYANRIAHGRILHAGRQWQLALASGSRHHLHGGPGGFHSRRWHVEQRGETELLCSLRSEDGDQGYPGALDVQVIHRLRDAMTVEMEMRATATAPTPVAITNHAYFNLDGASSDVRGHRLQVNASQYLPVDAELIPHGSPVPVAGTAFDFRAGKTIASDYDHALLLDDACTGMRQPALQLTSRRGDLRLAIRTTLPALQVYTGACLAGTAAPGGGEYPAHAGIALEPGYLPDSPNHPEWLQPSCWLMPGETWLHRICYSFGV